MQNTPQIFIPFCIVCFLAGFVCFIEPTWFSFLFFLFL